MMSTSALGQFNEARSQLATNSFLLVLGQVFGTTTFTSRDVANRLGLDFLNTCKRLSRMSKKPYYLLSAVRFARPWGGYENSYAISSRGWSKISYLQYHPVRARKPVTANSPLEQWAARYLMKGKGKVDEVLENACFSSLGAPLMLPIYPPLDEIGLLLLNFDPRVIPLETLNRVVGEVYRTVNRAKYLQGRGLIPQDINVKLFVINAYQMGISSPTIIIGLVLRREIELCNELAALKESSSVKQTTQATQTTQHKSSPPPRTDYENCSRYEKLLDREKLYSKSVELENSSLQKKLDKASSESTLESIRLNNRITALLNHIERNTRCLALVSEELEKFKDPSGTLLPVKSFINYALAGIILMNSMA